MPGVKPPAAGTCLCGRPGLIGHGITVDPALRASRQGKNQSRERGYDSSKHYLNADSEHKDNPIFGENLFLLNFQSR